MTVLAQLQSIDLSAVLSARGEISVSVNGEEFQALVNGEGITNALGTLGSAIAAIENAQENPEALLEPIIAAVANLAPLFDQSDLDLSELIAVVQEGAQIVAQLFTLLGGDNPANLTIANGGKLGDLLNHAGNFSQHFSKVGFDQAGDVKHIIDTIEQGLPSDTTEFAEYAVGLLLPFNTSYLKDIRERINTMAAGAAGIEASIELDANINSGLIASLDRITLAANAGDAVQVNRELAGLTNVRNTTLNSIRAALTRVNNQFAALDLNGHMQTIESIADHFTISSESVLDFLDKLRQQFEEIRILLETVELPDLEPIIAEIHSRVEALLRENIEAPIDRSVEDVKVWLRNQLAHLNLRYYRGLITQFFKTIETEIKNANLDGPAIEARSFLNTLESTIANFDMAGEINGILGDAGTTINTVVTNLQNALQAIVDGVNAAAAGAQAVLEQVADLLEQFQQTIDSITQSVENLGIDQARDAVIDAISDLKDTAEAVLGVAPLPDAMKPLVDDVIKELGNIDVDQILAPVLDSVNQLQIPPSVLEPVNEILDEAAQVVQNLITEELITELEAEFQSALDELNKFDPANLLSEVTDYFDQAAEFIEQLDPRPVVENIRGPYDQVLQAVDLAHPNRLLAPVINAYENVFSAIDVPDPTTAIQGLNNTVSEASEQIGQAVSQPLQQLTGQTASAPGEAPISDQPADALPQVQPGDIIRLLGYVPNKLREALQALDEGVVGEVLAIIDSFCRQLAEQIRQLQQQLWQAERTVFAGFDALIKPLSTAQLQAQLAIGASFSVSSTDLNAEVSTDISVDVSAASELLASMSSACIRAELAEEMAQTRANITSVIGRAGGSGGAFLDRLATLLDNCALANIATDLDALLQALDPEPLAAELDAAARAAINRIPEIITLLDDGAKDAINRLLLLLQQFNPVTQGLKFLSVFDVIREELEILNPRRLAAELAEIHLAIRNIIVAYDPGVFAEEVYDLVEAVAGQIRALDPGALLGDLTQFDNLSATLADLNPATALAAIDGQLDEVGARLGEINLDDLLNAINAVPGQVTGAVTDAGQAVIDNLKALLESIQYFSGEASASVSVSVG